MNEYKAIIWFFGFIMLGMVVWDFIGFDSGSGGIPYGEVPYHEQSLE